MLMSVVVMVLESTSVAVSVLPFVVVMVSTLVAASARLEALVTVQTLLRGLHPNGNNKHWRQVNFI